MTAQEKELTSQIKGLDEEVKLAKPDPARQKKLEKEIESFEKSKDLLFYFGCLSSSEKVLPSRQNR